LVISEHAVVAGVGDINVTRTVYRDADGHLDPAEIHRRAQAVGHDAVVVRTVAHEVSVLPENRDRRKTARKRSGIGENDGAAVDRIHRVQVFVGVDRYLIVSTEPVVEALCAGESAGAIVGLEVTGAVGPSAAGAESLVGDHVPRASGAVALWSASARRAERIEIHQEPGDGAAGACVRHIQITLRIDGDSGRRIETRVAGSAATVILKAAAAGAECLVRRLTGQR
jgi:hypothetical protein